MLCYRINMFFLQLICVYAFCSIFIIINRFRIHQWQQSIYTLHNWELNYVIKTYNYSQEHIPIYH